MVPVSIYQLKKTMFGQLVKIMYHSRWTKSLDKKAHNETEEVTRHLVEIFATNYCGYEVPPIAKGNRSVFHTTMCIPYSMPHGLDACYDLIPS